MAKNDLDFMLPDASGVRACGLAVSELSRFAVSISDRVESSSRDPACPETTARVGHVLGVVDKLVASVVSLLKSCQVEYVDVQPQLSLAGARKHGRGEPDSALVQYRDLLAWDATQREPDPGSHHSQ